MDHRTIMWSHLTFASFHHFELSTELQNIMHFLHCTDESNTIEHTKLQQLLKYTS